MRARFIVLALVVPSALATACEAYQVEQDGRDDSFFAGGKADGTIAEGSPEALAVLAVVNTASEQQLTAAEPDGAGLGSDTVASVLEFRAGDDGKSGTEDDRVFSTLEQLDTVDFVGAVALDKLLAFGDGHGYLAPTAFRVTKVSLMDPHVSAKALFLCPDVTTKFNARFAANVTTDEDGDHLIDLNLMSVFRPDDRDAAKVAMQVGAAACTAPLSSMSCHATDALVSTFAHNQKTGTCLAPMPGTTGGYQPAIVPTKAPCLVSEPATITVPISGVEVTLTDARAAATYVADHDVLKFGSIVGFLSEKTADKLTLPDHIPFAGGKPLSSLFPGGKNNCSNADDRDEGPGGESGWYLYLNFEAETVEFDPNVL